MTVMTRLLARTRVFSGVTVQIYIGWFGLSHYSGIPTSLYKLHVLLYFSRWFCFNRVVEIVNDSLIWLGCVETLTICLKFTLSIKANSLLVLQNINIDCFVHLMLYLDEKRDN